MRLVIVQPNITGEVSRIVEAEARRHAAPGTEIVMATAAFGAPWVETRSEMAIAAHAVLAAFAAEAEGTDAGIVAGFGDPGAAAARELFDFPVIGLAEAAMHTACLLGGRFSVLTVGVRWRQLLRETASHYGLASRLASVRAIAPRGEEDSRRHDWAAAGLLQEGRCAVEEDGAEVLILGGGGLAGLARDLAGRLPVPILDGVACAVRQAELLVGLAPRKPATGSFAPPRDKAMRGLDVDLARAFLPAGAASARKR